MGGLRILILPLINIASQILKVNEDPQKVVDSRLVLQVEGLELGTRVHWYLQIVLSDSLLHLH